jgi:hypothetical protein
LRAIDWIARRVVRGTGVRGCVANPLTSRIVAFVRAAFESVIRRAGIQSEHRVQLNDQHRRHNATYSGTSEVALCHVVQKLSAFLDSIFIVDAIGLRYRVGTRIRAAMSCRASHLCYFHASNLCRLSGGSLGSAIDNSSTTYHLLLSRGIRSSRITKAGYVSRNT